MRWKESVTHSCWTVHGVQTWRCCWDYQQQWHTLDLACGGRHGGTGNVAGQSWLFRSQHAAEDLQSNLHLLREEGFVLWSQIAIDKAYWRLLLDVCTSHGAGEWAYTQSMFQTLRIWELGKLRRVVSLRRRPNECWLITWKRTSVIVARQFKKHN